ncbi:IclR family transcriptional regulator [Actinomadura sp. 1N219]|uniref:IclR family transcriptional regulator n=1 Tax=Actinomadura sp. 1N219 TaxID=3375152 RepID=UPI0037B9A12E
MKRGVMSQTVERAVKLLFWLAERTADSDTAEHSLGDIASGVELDKATTYRLAQSLVKFDLIEHDPRSRRYRLGSGAMVLARAAMQGHAFLGQCMPVLRLLSERTGETVSLSERRGLSSMTIYEIESGESVRYANKIGRAVPLHVAAGPRAILAWSAPETRRTVVEGELASFTPNTITDAGALRRTLEATRERGYAHSFGERTPAVHSLAAPVFGEDGYAVGSVCILWPSRGEETDAERLRTWPGLLMDAVKSVQAGGA